jgi:anti-anti-sigma regulatory factor
MIELDIDKPRNLFVIRYHGNVTAEETRQSLDRVFAGIDQMQQGFGLLADLTDLASMEVACAPHIEATMDYANSKGVAAVVRVIPDPTRDIGMQIMSRFHYGANVQVLTTATLAEAMRILFD